MIGWKIIFEEKRKIRQARKHCELEQLRHLRRQDRKQHPQDTVNHPGSRCLPAFEIRELPFSIGRLSGNRTYSTTCNYAVADMSPYLVSRVHCCLTIENGQVMLCDMESHLGTLLNGKPLGIHGNIDSDFLLEGDNYITLGPSDSPYKFIIHYEAPLTLKMRPDF